MNDVKQKAPAAAGLCGFFQGDREKDVQHSDFNKSKWSAIFSGIVVLTGICGMLVVISYDFFKGGTPQFGDRQLAGFAICAIITLAGLNRIVISQARLLKLPVLLIYVAGIMFFGLRPKAFDFQSTGILRDFSFSFSDLTTNVLGFIPLGYMLTSLFFSVNRKKTWPTIMLTVAACCFGLSFLIEVSQSFIPGRVSSSLDILYNGLGTLLGVGYYFFSTKASNRK